MRTSLVEITGGEKVKHAFLFLPDTSEVMVKIHFALLYLRGGLCWDWGLACRRSTAIFTSENKSIQTLNITMTCRSANVVHAKWLAAPTLSRSRWNRVPGSKFENPNWAKDQKTAELSCQIWQIEMEWTRNSGVSPFWNLLVTGKGWTK